MTNIDILKLINSMNEGKISKKMFNQIVNYFNENSEKSAQIERWQKEAELKKQVLLAMGFSNPVAENYCFKKIIYENEKEGKLVEEEVYFIDDIVDRISVIEYSRYPPHLFILTIENILQKENQHKFADLVKYFEIRNDIKAMKKLIEQEKKE